LTTALLNYDLFIGFSLRVFVQRDAVDGILRFLIGDLAERGVLAIEKRRGFVADEELRAPELGSSLRAIDRTPA